MLVRFVAPCVVSYRVLLAIRVGRTRCRRLAQLLVACGVLGAAGPASAVARAPWRRAQPPRPPAADNGLRASAVAAGAADHQVLLGAEVLAAAGVVTETLRPYGVDTLLGTVGQVTYADGLVSHVTCPVRGRVRHIYAGLGEQVHRGDALAAIDSPDMGQARADLDKARAELTATQEDLVRQESLFAARACSQRDVEMARDAYRRAQAERARAAKKWSLLGGGDTLAPGQQFILRAPLDGVVLQRSLSLGEEVQGQLDAGSSGDLFVLANLDTVWVVADVYELDLGRVALGAKATIERDAGDAVTKTDPIAGRVEWISEVLDPNVRTAKIRCAYDNRDRKLTPNTFVTLRIAAAGKDALTVAKTSLLHISGQAFVFVAQGRDERGRSAFSLRPVVIDDDNDAEGTRVPVYHGLVNGDEVVVRGMEGLMQTMLQQQRARQTW